jgi:hypothetical protein
MSPPLDRASNATIVFENDDLCVLFRAGGSAHLLITFGDAITFARERRYFAETIADEFDLNALGFMAKTPNWFPQNSMTAAMPHLRTLLAAFPRRLLYGCSMGGYGAIKFSRLLGATDVVALSPQWSIDPDECGDVESGFRQLFTPSMRGMGIRPSDIAGRLNILYDPGHPDDPYHFATLQRMSPGARGYRVHHGGHNLLGVLAGRRLAFDLLTACLDAEGSRIYGVINIGRRRSTVRRRSVLVRAAALHPILTLRAIRQLHANGQGLDFDPVECLLPLHQALLRRGEIGLAQDSLRQLAPMMSELRARSIRDDVARLQRGEARDITAHLSTAHRTGLFFNAVGGCFRHRPAQMDAVHQVGLHAVFPFSTDGVSVLVTSIDGEILACHIQPNGSVDLAPFPERDIFRCFRVVAAGSSAVQISLRHAYLSAEPNGAVSRQTSTPDRWESFEVLEPGAT